MEFLEVAIVGHLDFLARHGEKQLLFVRSKVNDFLVLSRQDCNHLQLHIEHQDPPLQVSQQKQVLIENLHLARLHQVEQLDLVVFLNAVDVGCLKIQENEVLHSKEYDSVVYWVDGNLEDIVIELGFFVLRLQQLVGVYFLTDESNSLLRGNVKQVSDDGLALELDRFETTHFAQTPELHLVTVVDGHKHLLLFQQTRGEDLAQMSNQSSQKGDFNQVCGFLKLEERNGGSVGDQNQHLVGKAVEDLEDGL